MDRVKEMVKKNYELSKQLSAANDAVYTDIACYLRTSALDEVEVEEILQEILGMILSAQQRGEGIETVIGNDYKAFCDAIIESSQPKGFTWRRFFSHAEIVVQGIIILWLIDLIMNYVPKMIKTSAITLDYHVSLGFVLSTMIILFSAFFIINYIGKNSFALTAEKTQFKAKYRWMFGALVGGLFALVVLISVKLSGYVLFTVKVYYLAIILALLYLFVKAAAKTTYASSSQ